MSVDPKKKTVWLQVPVEVPEDFDESIDLTHFLNMFINFGFDDLAESVENVDVDSTEEEEKVVKETTWGEAIIEVKF